MITALLGRLFRGVGVQDQADDRARRDAAHEATLRELEAARRELEHRVAERTRESSLMTARFETALRGAKVYVFSQDVDLRYTWIYSPRAGASGAELLGRTDEEVLPAVDRDLVLALKRRVLETGVAEDCELAFIMPEGRRVFSLHVDPTFGPDKKIDGIMCAAVGVSH